jgi:hypothetical protein
MVEGANEAAFQSFFFQENYFECLDFSLPLPGSLLHLYQKLLFADYSNATQCGMI